MHKDKLGEGEEEMAHCQSRTALTGRGEGGEVTHTEGRLWGSDVTYQMQSLLQSNELLWRCCFWHLCALSYGRFAVDTPTKWKRNRMRVAKTILTSLPSTSRWVSLVWQQIYATFRGYQLKQSANNFWQHFLNELSRDLSLPALV